eukprot:GILI01017078.1.p1 GENE.GILI01017078.1~~GILI01017078.1.p1  ORF type:complete len:155 (-),score=21.17 GILI01017078.1:37-501(-)
MKKKYSSRFPMARVKKIMQMDEEVGKIATATPVLISKALEMFIQELLEQTAQVTKGRRAKTVTAGHVKACVLNNERFDFLKSLVDKIPDVEEKEAESEKKSRGRPPRTGGNKTPTASGANPSFPDEYGAAQSTSTSSIMSMSNLLSNPVEEYEE